jgi:hypothetical protein
MNVSSKCFVTLVYKSILICHKQSRSIINLASPFFFLILLNLHHEKSSKKPWNIWIQIQFQMKSKRERYKTQTRQHQIRIHPQESKLKYRYSIKQRIYK